MLLSNSTDGARKKENISIRVPPAIQCRSSILSVGWTSRRKLVSFELPGCQLFIVEKRIPLGWTGTRKRNRGSSDFVFSPVAEQSPAKYASRLWLIVSVDSCQVRFSPAFRFLSLLRKIVGFLVMLTGLINDRTLMILR